MSDEELNIPEEYTPVSMWSFLGHSLLFSIPCAGIILLFVYAFGGTKRINLRNYARAQLFLIGILFAIYFIVLVSIGISIMAAASY